MNKYSAVILQEIEYIRSYFRKTNDLIIPFGKPDSAESPFFSLKTGADQASRFSFLNVRKRPASPIWI